MRSSIWATLHHKLSTDDNSQHDQCPIGEDSWCSRQRANATNALDEYKHKPALPMEVYKAIKQIYEELTSENLLTRCICGYTQNSNESFNSTVGIDLKIHYIAFCVYNDRFSSILHIMKAMDLEIGPSSYEMCLIDKECIKHAERSLCERVNEARIASRSSRKAKQEQDDNLECQLYGAGITD